MIEHLGCGTGGKKPRIQRFDQSAGFEARNESVRPSPAPPFR
jgi:hypothetical protein